jgi:hypothetical protein
MSTQIKKNGNWVTVAGGTRMWVGTKAALQAALDAGELVDGTAVMVTDDYEENNAIVDVTGYSTPGKASGQETIKRTGNIVLIDFTAVKANNVKVFTGLPKPVNMTQNVLFDGAICTTAYITVDGEVFVDAPGAELYGQLVYFTND